MKQGARRKERLLLDQSVWTNKLKPPLMCFFHHFNVTVISAGDVDAQRKLLQEMQEMNIKPTSFTYDELMETYLLQ